MTVFAKGHRLLILCAAIGMFFIAPAVGADAAKSWHMTGAGDASGLWVLSPIHSPRLEGEETSPERGQLHYFPASAPMGTAMGLRAHVLGEPPAVMTAHGDRLVLLYPGTVASTAESSVKGANAERTIPVRSVRLTLVRTPVVFLDPPDRFTVQPPLRTTGSLLHAVDTDVGLFALLWVDGHLALQMMDYAGWREVDLPGDLGLTASTRLVKHPDGVSLLSRDKGGKANLWSLDSTKEAWTSVPAPDDAVGRRLFTAGGVVVIPELDGSTKTLSLRSIEGDKLIPLATVSDVAVDYTAAAVGENIAVVWFDGDVSARLRVVILSSITGRTLYDGYARFPPPLSPSDLRFVMVLLAAVMLGVLLFVLKPETIAESAPPAGCVLAEPGRRFASAGIDLVIAGLISSALWGVSIADAINPGAFFLLTGNESWPIVTTLGIFFVHGVLGEWIFGRTIGKAMVGCRVSSTRGSRIKLWQAVARNLIKGVAPPLVVFILFDPNRRHPGDLMGGTIVIKNAKNGIDKGDESASSTDDESSEESGEKDEPSDSSETSDRE
jgi:uncharacterized RDD family membrane protein YckC